MANVIKRSVDALRTAPFGFSLIGLTILNGPVLALTENGAEALDLLVIPLDGASVAIGGIFVVRQYRLRRRLEDSIERNGYDDRLFDPTTKEWCNRQTARVVCGNSGDLAQYEALCEQKRATNELPRMPHV